MYEIGKENKNKNPNWMLRSFSSSKVMFGQKDWPIRLGMRLMAKTEPIDNLVVMSWIFTDSWSWWNLCFGKIVVHLIP